MNDYDVTESATLTLDASEATGARWNAVLIRKGWGSKGYYTEEALKNDGPTVFKAGTPIFMDHLTPADKDFYSFGKVANLVGELATDAKWDVEEQGLVAEVDIFEHQRGLVKSVAKKVGLSVRAVTQGQPGSMDGRNGKIFTKLVGAKSVDLVVRAGAGGQFLEVLESDTIEMDEDMSAEVLEAIANLSKNVDERFNGMDSRLTSVEESLVAEAEVVEPEAVVVAEPDVDIAKTVSELVAAELAKTREPVIAVSESADDEGTEENVDDVEESATTATEIKLPRRWVAKGAK